MTVRGFSPAPRWDPKGSLLPSSKCSSPPRRKIFQGFFWLAQIHWENFFLTGIRTQGLYLVYTSEKHDHRMVLSYKYIMKGSLMQCASECAWVRILDSTLIFGPTKKTWKIFLPVLDFHLKGSKYFIQNSFLFWLRITSCPLIKNCGYYIHFYFNKTICSH